MAGASSYCLASAVSISEVGKPIRQTLQLPSVDEGNDLKRGYKTRWWLGIPHRFTYVRGEDKKFIWKIPHWIWSVSNLRLIT